MPVAGYNKPQLQNHVPVTRTPVSGEMIICYSGKWQVCYQARGKIDDRKALAWVYGPDSKFFCEVGDEQFRCDVPIPDTRPFFNDQFNYTIEMIDEEGVRLERLAGAGNVSVALAAYLEAIRTHPNRLIQMRTGMRLVRRSDEKD